MINSDTIQRYIEGKALQQEKEEIAGWLDADEKNMQDFLVLRRIYDATLWSEEKADGKKPTVAKNRFLFVYAGLKYAAIFFIGFVFYHFLFPAKQNAEAVAVVMQTIHVPEGQRAEIILVDGTKVWLNANTSFSFPNQFPDSERRVELNGEAYFDVKRDESKMFIVQTEGHQVNVYGTEFNVKAYQQKYQFEVALIKGSVEILADRTNEKILLQPDCRVFTDNDKLVQTPITSFNPFLWKEGIIAFEKECVKDIFEKLELYYDVRIELKNKKIQKHLYTGKFRTKDGVEHVLKVLQLRHQFEYVKSNETNTITIY